MAVVEKRMRQREAAERLGVTQRQVKRLAARYRVAGAAGVAATGAAAEQRDRGGEAGRDRGVGAGSATRTFRRRWRTRS